MGALLERRQRRATARMPIDSPGKVDILNKTYPVQLIDVSIGGVNLSVDAAYESFFRSGTEMPLSILAPATFADHPFHVVIRNIRVEGSLMQIGAQFVHHDVEEMKRKVLLVNGSSDRWMQFQNRRERRLGVMRSALFLMQCGIRYSVEHFAYVMLSPKERKQVKAFSPASQTP